MLLPVLLAAWAAAAARQAARLGGDRRTPWRVRAARGLPTLAVLLVLAPAAARSARLVVERRRPAAAEAPELAVGRALRALPAEARLIGPSPFVLSYLSGHRVLAPCEVADVEPAALGGRLADAGVSHAVLRVAQPADGLRAVLAATGALVPGGEAAVGPYTVVALRRPPPGTIVAEGPWRRWGCWRGP